MVKFSPNTGIAYGLLAKNHVDMRVPFQAAPESMQDANHAGHVIFGFISSVETESDGVRGGFKQQVQQSTVNGEVFAQFFGNGKNNMPVGAFEQLRRHV